MMGVIHELWMECYLRFCWGFGVEGIDYVGTEGAWYVWYILGRRYEREGWWTPKVWLL